jgi:hypothetical protein
MTQDITSLPEGLEQLRRQFAEFRTTQPVRSRLPEPLWAAATELATRYGVPATARVLHLDYTRLKTRVASRKRPKPARSRAPRPSWSYSDQPVRRPDARWKWKPLPASSAWSCPRSPPPSWSRSSARFSVTRVCCRSRRRCGSWSPWSRWTDAKASTASFSCAGRGSPPIRFRVACLCFGAAARPRFGSWPMTARGFGWRRNGCQKAALSGGRVGPGPLGGWKRIKRSCC